MKSFIAVMVLSSGMAFANSVNVSVTNFNFTYSDPHGQGTATSFNRSPAFTSAVSVTVDKVDKDFVLKVEGAETGEFTLKDAPAFMTDAATMNVTGFNLNLAEKLTLSLTNGHFLSKDDELKLTGLNLDCNRDSTSTELMDQLLTGCLQRMSLKSSKFSSTSVEENFVSIMTDALVGALDEKGNLGINSLDLKTTNGKYDLAAEVKSQISGKVKSNGNMSYDKTTGTVSVKISEVKFGILNITGKVFDELKKKESEKLKVKEPFVHYKLK